MEQQALGPIEDLKEAILTAYMEALLTYVGFASVFLGAMLILMDLLDGDPPEFIPMGMLAGGLIFLAILHS